MWTYSQSSGLLTKDGLALTAYAGNGDGKNNPDMQDVSNVGPLPRGLYLIQEPHDSPAHGPFCMRLIPDATNEMYGRSLFLLHGDSILRPGEASEGCIVTYRQAREAVWNSGDRALEVVR